MVAVGVVCLLEQLKPAFLTQRIAELGYGSKVQGSPQAAVSSYYVPGASHGRAWESYCSFLSTQKPVFLSHVECVSAWFLFPISLNYWISSILRFNLDLPLFLCLFSWTANSNLAFDIHVLGKDRHSGLLWSYCSPIKLHELIEISDLQFILGQPMAICCESCFCNVVSSVQTLHKVLIPFMCYSRIHHDVVLKHKNI